MKTKTNKDSFANIFVKDAPVKGFSLLSTINDFIFSEYNQPYEKENIKEGTVKEMWFRPSKIAKAHCVRKMVFEFTNAEFEIEYSSLPAKTHRVFHNGNNVHTRLQEYLAELGKWSKGEIELIGKWKCSGCEKSFGGYNDWIPKPTCKKCKGKYDMIYRECPVRDEKRKIAGTADGCIVFKDKRYLIEIKSINSFGYQKLNGIPEYYIPQAHTYMMLSGIDTMIFLFEDKNTQDIREIHEVYDYNLIKPKMNLVAKANQYIVDKKLPPKLTLAKEVKEHCTECEYQAVCKSKNYFAYSLQIQQPKQ